MQIPAGTTPVKCDVAISILDYSCTGHSKVSGRGGGVERGERSLVPGCIEQSQERVFGFTTILSQEKVKITNA